MFTKKCLCCICKSIINKVVFVFIIISLIAYQYLWLHTGKPTVVSAQNSVRGEMIYKQCCHFANVSQSTLCKPLQKAHAFNIKRLS